MQKLIEKFPSDFKNNPHSKFYLEQSKRVKRQFVENRGNTSVIQRTGEEIKELLSKPLDDFQKGLDLHKFIVDIDINQNDAIDQYFDDIYKIDLLRDHKRQKIEMFEN